MPGTPIRPPERPPGDGLDSQKWAPLIRAPKRGRKIWLFAAAVIGLIVVFLTWRVQQGQ